MMIFIIAKAAMVDVSMHAWKLGQCLINKTTSRSLWLQQYWFSNDNYDVLPFLSLFLYRVNMPLNSLPVLRCHAEAWNLIIVKLLLYA